MINNNWNYPTTMWVGKNRIKDLSEACKNLDIKKPLLVTDSGLSTKKIIHNALKDLNNKKIKCEMFSNVVGNPTGSNVIEGVDFFKKKSVMELLQWVVEVP